MSTNIHHQINQRVYDPTEYFKKIETTASIETNGTISRKYQDYLTYWECYQAPPHSIVLISMPNSLDMIAMFFAILNSGYVPAPISQTTPAERIRQMLDDFKAVAVVKNYLSTSHWEKMDIHDVADLDNWFVGSREISNSVSLAQYGQVVIATSGTSSAFSSGCVHDFESLRRNAVRHGESVGLSASDRMLVSLPLCYSTALVSQLICAMEFNCSLVISGPPFSVRDYRKDLSKFEITVSSLTPVLLRQLNLHPDKLAKSLKKLLIGGDFAPSDEVEKCLNKNPGLELYLTYGISEAGPRVSTCSVHNLNKRYYSSVGLPLEGTEVRLQKTTKEAKSGELLISSNTLMKRKIGQSNKDPFVIIEGKNWLKSGDLFEIDDDGYLFFKGRLSDFIILRGEKVNLSAIKTLCRGINGVLTCKTKVSQENGTPTGYTLTLICDEDVISAAECETTSNFIRSKLTHHEQPSLLELIRINPNSLDQYK